MLEVLVKLLITLLIIVLVLSLAFILFLLFISRGEIEPFLTEDSLVIEDSIAEKIQLEINGADQGMIIRGKNKNNPVLLFVHGGPGVPEYFLNETYPTALEDHFTVCWWEARGGGLSYDDRLSADEISLSLLVDDAIAVSEYLLARFDQEKIYLLGHSFGSLIGIKLAAERPDLFYAYIGMAQVSGGELSGERANTLTYRYMIDYFQSVGDEHAIGLLNRWSQIQPDGTVVFDPNYLGKIDELKHQAGCGTMHEMKSVISGIFFPQLFSRAYSIGEKINFWKGKAFMRYSRAYQEMLELDLFAENLQVEIPVYFFSGIYDYTCPYPLMKEFFDRLEAQEKAFYTFHDSAHSPLWEEPDKALEILLEDVLSGKMNLSDPCVNHRRY